MVSYLLLSWGLLLASVTGQLLAKSDAWSQQGCTGNIIYSTVQSTDCLCGGYNGTDVDIHTITECVNGNTQVRIRHWSFNASDPCGGRFWLTYVLIDLNRALIITWRARFLASYMQIIKTDIHFGWTQTILLMCN